MERSLYQTILPYKGHIAEMELIEMKQMSESRLFCFYPYCIRAALFFTILFVLFIEEEIMTHIKL